MPNSAPWRVNQRDPLVAEMLGTGKAWDLTEELVAGHRQQVFAGVPRNLAGLYQQAMTHADRTMIVQDGTAAYLCAGIRSGRIARHCAD